MIKFCRKTKKIIIPANIQVIGEILRRAEIDTSFQVKHASTTEAAQEELLICLGLTLK